MSETSNTITIEDWQRMKSAILEEYLKALRPIVDPSEGRKKLAEVSDGCWDGNAPFNTR